MTPVKRFKRLRKNVKWAISKDEQVLNDLDIIEKELKALEIIKEKMLQVCSLQEESLGNDVSGRTPKYFIYDNEWFQKVELSKQEYELLKEVLL